MKGNLLDKLSAENLSDEGGQQSEDDDPEEAKFGFSDAQLERFKALYEVAKASIQQSEFPLGAQTKNMDGYIFNESSLEGKEVNNSAFSRSLFYMHGSCELIKDEQSGLSTIVHSLLQD